MAVASGVVDVGVQVMRSWDCIACADVGTCLFLGRDNSTQQVGWSRGLKNDPGKACSVSEWSRRRVSAKQHPSRMQTIAPLEEVVPS